MAFDVTGGVVLGNMGKDDAMNLLDKIDSRQATVAVIGLGYVGLPVAVAFAEAGFRVVGIDTNQARVASVNAGSSYIPDVPSQRLATFVTGEGGRDTAASPVDGGPSEPVGGRISATSDYGIISDADAAIICVPTPLSKTKDPDLSHIVSAADEISRRLHPNMLVVLESTSYPGATEEVILPRLSRPAGSGQTFEVGVDFFLAFSPERIDPGNSRWNVCNTPKVIGGVTPRCLEMAKALYQSTVDTVVPVSSTRVAEMTKLLENSFRAVNIALVNELAMMCDRLGVDPWEVIDAAASKPFGFMPFYPGPGLGGHCIPIDPQYLVWKMRTLDFEARFIQLATQINYGMPDYVYDKIVDSLNDAAKPVNGSRVLVIGVAYKADVGDTRESPALDMIARLQEKGAKVTYHDPYVHDIEVGGAHLSSVDLTRHVFGAADCVVIMTAHSALDCAAVVEHSSLIVDTRNATKGIDGPARIVKL